MMKRKIALDVGDVRIGVAVSDLMGLCANPRETYVRKKDDEAADIAYFVEYAKKRTRTRLSSDFPKYGRNGRRPRNHYARFRRKTPRRKRA